MNKAYLTNYTRRINGLKVELPDELLEVIKERNQGNNNLLAMGFTSKSKTKSISLYDKSVEKYLAPEHTEIIENYIDKFTLEGNNLNLTPEAKEFLDLENKIILAGNFYDLTLWKPEGFEEYQKYITSKYPQELKELPNKVFNYFP